jgi:hypothetical protein
VEQNTTNQPQPFNVYCNGISIATSPYDFTFFLNNNSPQGTTYLGEIKMSPEHAKVFARMLMEHVQQFEELFGEIPQVNEEKVKKLQEEGKIIVEG